MLKQCLTAGSSRPGCGCVTPKFVRATKVGETEVEKETEGVQLETSFDESGKRMFHCPACQYKTPNRSRVQEHLFTHTNERPFKCTQCDFETRRNRDLKRHMLIHGGKKKIQYYLCHIYISR